MALNTMRAEAEIVVGGKTYRCALTLDALARLGPALGIDNMRWNDFAQRFNAILVADMQPMLKAILIGNGYEVGDADIAAANPFDVMAFLPALLPRKQEAEPAAAASGGASKGNGKARTGTTAQA